MADVTNPSTTTQPGGRTEVRPYEGGRPEVRPYEQALEAAVRLQQLLQNLPADARRDKALYHLDRLQRAVSASHQEAVRFAAFTVNNTVHDAAADWGPPIVAAMAGLRDALHAKGHEF